MKRAKVVEPAEVVQSIKGFNADMTCRGYQFAIGGTYRHEGSVAACNSGFHAIGGYPLEVFEYYAPGQSRYADVEQSGAISKHDIDSKVASATITIKAELHIPALVERAVKWIIAQCVPADAKHSEGYRSAASSTGYQSAASSTGDQSAASSTGDRSAASSTGYQSAASSTGYQSAAMSSGRLGKVMAEKDGCALFLVHRTDDWEITQTWSGLTGKNGIEAGRWYQLSETGEPVEVTA